MKQYEVWTIFGTRPETIKMAPVVKALQAHPRFRCRICVTGQHRQMLDQVLQAYQIQPDWDLDIMEAGQDLTQITCRVLEGLRGLFREQRPDFVLVHGDTTTAFAAALAAFYAGVPVGHVEAGLRTYDKKAPFPEEANRCLISELADLHFAPTAGARFHLVQEGIEEKRIFVTGNTAIDALHLSLAMPCPDGDLQSLLDWAEGSRLLLLTAHRRENLGEPMRAMFRGIARMLREDVSLKLVYPVHLNPTVQRAAQEAFGDLDRVRLIDPLDVLQFHHLLSAAELVLTDSGGIQEEAPSLGKPVLVLRNTTERPEGVEAGTLRLVGTEETALYEALRTLLTRPDEYEKMSRAQNPYGDGQAAKRLVQILLQQFEPEERDRVPNTGAGVPLV